MYNSSWRYASVTAGNGSYYRPSAQVDNFDSSSSSARQYGPAIRLATVVSELVRG